MAGAAMSGPRNTQNGIEAGLDGLARSLDEWTVETRKSVITVRSTIKQLLSMATLWAVPYGMLWAAGVEPETAARVAVLPLLSMGVFIVALVFAATFHRVLLLDKAAELMKVMKAEGYLFPKSDGGGS